MLNKNSGNEINRGSQARTFLEFFAGGGMARIGLGAGWRCLFANDFDARKCAAYCDNFGAADLVEADIAGPSVARPVASARLDIRLPKSSNLAVFSLAQKLGTE